MDKLLDYLNGLPKEQQSSFAEACGTTVGYLRKAASAGQLLSTATCVAIERESGGAVTRKDLRPNDWEENWPELVDEPKTRRATDPEPDPAPKRSGRKPPSRKRMLATSIDKATLRTKKNPP